MVVPGDLANQPVSMMEFAEVLRGRRMIRSFDPARSVPPEMVEAIVAAAIRAPSAGFTQGVSFLILEQPTERDTFWALTAGPTNPWLRGMRTAPVLIMVWTSQCDYLDRYAEPDKGWTDDDLGRWSAPYWWVDAGMATMGALLSAVDHQLGACFFGIPPTAIDTVRAAFGVPDQQSSVGVIALGYAATEAGPSGSPTRRVRRPKTELIHRGHW